METNPDSTLALLTDIVRCLDDKKAEDLRVLKVGAQSSITDYLVLATGTSEPHLRALRVELEKVIDQRKAPIAGMDSGEPGSGWTVVDAYQVMVHLFTSEKREQYRLENLWKDAQDVSLTRLLPPKEETTVAPAPAAVTSASAELAATPAVQAVAAPAGDAPSAASFAEAKPASTARAKTSSAKRQGVRKAKPSARAKAKSGARPLAKPVAPSPAPADASERPAGAARDRVKRVPVPKGKAIVPAKAASSPKRKAKPTTKTAGAPKKASASTKAASKSKPKASVRASAKPKAAAKPPAKPKGRSAARR